MTIILFLIVLAVLIFVHELGHFLVARACGVRVDEFKIGFGPKLLKWKRGETEYGLNLIPFGGFVKIFGEDPDEESTHGPEARRSFVNQQRWKQVLVLVAGVTFNFLFAWLIYVGVFSTGINAAPEDFPQYADRFTNERVMIVAVSPGSPADKAGIRAGDVVRSISVAGSAGTVDSHSSVTDIQTVLNASQGNEITLTYARGADTLTTSMKAVTGITDGKYAIGVGLNKAVTFRLSFLSSVWVGLEYTGIMIKNTVVGLYTFVSTAIVGQAHLSDVSGPVGIAVYVGDAYQLGFSTLLLFTALISINLGVINLIPFPALDGGRVFFVFIEAVFRRRIPAKFTNVVNTTGFVLLMLLMVLVTWQDIAKLVM
jgi:regulator of sigma E protease